MIYMHSGEQKCQNGPENQMVSKLCLDNRKFFQTAWGGGYWMHPECPDTEQTSGDYSDVIISARVSQITSITVVYSTFYSGAGQRKHQSSTPLAFVQWIHRWPVNSPHKWPVTWKVFPCDDAIMTSLSQVSSLHSVSCLSVVSPGMILGLHPANERLCYFVTKSLIGWLQA